MSEMKSLKTILLFALLFCGSQIAGYSQSVISGKVINEQTGQGIAHVNVFLSQTTIGAATKADGTFEIRGIPNGMYNLVFSFVGFDPFVERIKLFKADSLHFQVSLRPVSSTMEGIVVTAKRDHKWLENLELFKREFLGTSENAEKTEIINPEVLNFKWEDDKSKLIASTNKELHVVNHALGYELFLVIDRFEYFPAVDSYQDKIVYLIYPRYKNLEADAKQHKKWAENRKDTYEGSIRHFMRALYHDRLNDEHFDIESGSIDKVKKKEKEYLLQYELISADYKKKLKAYEYSIFYDEDTKGLTIQYRNGDPSFFYPTEQNVFFIDEFGNILNPMAIFVGGSWFRDRIADALPMNYALKN